MAVYAIGEAEYEIPDDVQGGKLTAVLTQLAAQHKGSSNGVVESGGARYGRMTPIEEQPGPGIGRQIARQGAIAGRAALRGAASLPLAGLDVAGGAVNAGSRLMGGENVLPSFRALFDQGLVELGGELPGGQNLNASESVANAVYGGAAGAAGGLAAGQLLQGAASPVTRGVGDILVASPVAQAAAGASGGGSSELAAQAGLGPEAQALAGLAGGIGAGVAASRLDASLPNALPRGAATTAEQVIAGRQAAQQAQSVAQEGARRIGIDLDSLEKRVRDRFIMNADEAIKLGSDLQPEELARKALYESVGITPTKALVSRKFADALNEQNLLTEAEGQALRAIYAKNNQAIRSQIGSLAQKDGIDLPTYGQQFRSGLEEGAAGSKKTVDNFYAEARRLEGDNPADIDDLFGYMQANRSSLATAKAAKPIISFLKDAGLWGKDASKAFAKGEKVVLERQPTLAEMTDLRAVINAEASSPSATNNAKRLLGGMRSILDDAEAASGGDAYKQARTVFGKQKSLWEGNPLLVSLLKDKRGFRGVDQIPDEQVFNRAIINSTNDDFAAVWARSDSKAKDLTRTQLAKYIEGKTFSNMGTNEAGDVIASAAKLNGVLREINPQKLQVIYGKDKAAQLERLNRAVREISNPPRGTVPSGSAPKLSMLYRNAMGLLGLAGKIPVANVVVDVAEKRAAAQANQQAVDSAINLFQPSPISQPLLNSSGNVVAPLLLPATAASQ